MKTTAVLRDNETTFSAIRDTLGKIHDQKQIQDKQKRESKSNPDPEQEKGKKNPVYKGRTEKMKVVHAKNTDKSK